MLGVNGYVPSLVKLHNKNKILAHNKWSSGGNDDSVNKPLMVSATMVHLRVSKLREQLSYYLIVYIPLLLIGFYSFLAPVSIYRILSRFTVKPIDVELSRVKIGGLLIIFLSSLIPFLFL